MYVLQHARTWASNSFVLRSLSTDTFVSRHPYSKNKAEGQQKFKKAQLSSASCDMNHALARPTILFKASCAGCPDFNEMEGGPSGPVLHALRMPLHRQGTPKLGIYHGQKISSPITINRRTQTKGSGSFVLIFALYKSTLINTLLIINIFLAVHA